MKYEIFYTSKNRLLKYVAKNNEMAFNKIKDILRKGLEIEVISKQVKENNWESIHFWEVINEND